jgi:excisionase family DNA binding protein
VAEKYISTAEYAKKVGKSPRTIRDKIIAGTLPAVKIGNSYAIREDEPYIDARITHGKYVGMRRNLPGAGRCQQMVRMDANGIPGQLWTHPPRHS